MPDDSRAETRCQTQHSPMNVTNNVLKRAFNDDIPVTPMKLQRLLYLTAVDYARRTGGPLLYEPFQAWRYGPVLRSVYDKFLPIGHDPIRVYARNAAGEARLVNEAKRPEVARTVDAVWAEFRHVPVVELARIICQPGTVWHRTVSAGEGTPIPDRDIWSDVFFAPV